MTEAVRAVRPRRPQTPLEEAPAPGVGAALREELGVRVFGHRKEAKIGRWPGKSKSSGGGDVELQGIKSQDARI